MPAELTVLSGADIAPHLDDLARLRCAVFRDWPYLYDGDPANERAYLDGYTTEGAVLVLAELDGHAVGAATAMPLDAHGDAAQLTLPPEAPETDQIFYLAESVLLPQYRGQGLGHRFFDLREKAARAQGFPYCGFAAVIRPDDHPARPQDPRSHARFWQGRGYAPLAGAVATFTWTDRGEDAPTAKPLQFWLRRL